MAITRISITLPRDLARAIDARAKELDRSRSWVIAEAARQLLGAPQGAAPPARVVREESRPYVVTPGLGESRTRQLEADLKLTPGERVRIAEALAAEARLANPRVRRQQQIIGFDTLEDFYEWKKREGRAR